MNFIQNRYGISALSKKYKINSVNQEIMIDKTTGEVQVKSMDGSIFSYDYIARLNAHVDTLKFNSYNGDVYGKLYDVEIENKDLPMVVEKSVELLDGDLLISNGSFKSFIISVDLDSINPSRKISHLDIMEIPLSLSFKYENSGGTTEVFSTTSTVYKLSRTIFISGDFPKGITNIRLSKLQIEDSDLFDGHEQFILHSLLLNVE